MTAKPILIIKMPDMQSTAQAVEMFQKRKAEWEDYHVLIFSCGVDDPEVHVYYEKDQAPLDTAEFKKMLESSCINKEPNLFSDLIE